MAEEGNGEGKRIMNAFSRYPHHTSEPVHEIVFPKHAKEKAEMLIDLFGTMNLAEQRECLSILAGEDISAVKKDPVPAASTNEHDHHHTEKHESHILELFRRYPHITETPRPTFPFPTTSAERESLAVEIFLSMHRRDRREALALLTSLVE